MDETLLIDSRRKKARPSRGRGLRTTTGCLTCRKRRLKCDEGRPACGQCAKSTRPCAYAQETLSYEDRTLESPQQSSQRSLSGSTPIISAVQASPYHSDARGYSSRSDSILTPLERVSSATSSGLPNSLASRLGLSGTLSPTTCKISPADATTSPVTQAASFTPGQAPYEWWDLLAHDAVKSAQSYQALKDGRSRWSFDAQDASFSARMTLRKHAELNQAPREEKQSISVSIDTIETLDSSDNEAWHNPPPTDMSEQDHRYLEYYVNSVGPVFDLFDPVRTFTEIVPHLALRNRGLLMSLLAVSARLKSLHANKPDVQRSLDGSKQLHAFASDDDAAATQYYFDTLTYLQKAMQYQSYTRSREILATAALISSYELFHVDRATDWEKHLKGVFWIQRSQETNGERDGIRGAVWWNWLRQDIWAALWQSRKTLTIWEPTKHVSSLQGHEFASRAMYLFARAIRYATQDIRDSTDLNQRTTEGERHLQDLKDWYSLAPPTYNPLPSVAASSQSELFPPIWVHPPYQAAALQYYNAAKVLILLNRPSLGGMNTYRDRERLLNEAVTMICGLAKSPTALNFSSAMVHFQALYVAGQCVHTLEHQNELYGILERILNANRFPTTSLLDRLKNLWTAAG